MGRRNRRGRGAPPRQTARALARAIARAKYREVPPPPGAEPDDLYETHAAEIQWGGHTIRLYKLNRAPSGPGSEWGIHADDLLRARGIDPATVPLRLQSPGSRIGTMTLPEEFFLLPGEGGE